MADQQLRRPSLSHSLWKYIHARRIRMYNLNSELLYESTVPCPVCCEPFPMSSIEEHCNWCLVHKEGECKTPVKPSKQRTTNTIHPVESSPTTPNESDDNDLHSIGNISGGSTASDYSTPLRTKRRKRLFNPSVLSPWSPGQFDFGNYGMTDEEIAKRINEEETRRFNYLQLHRERMKKLEFESMRCQQCSRQLDLEGTLVMDNCEHIFCRDCMRAYLTIFTQQEANCTIVQCPVAKCGQVVSESIMRDILDATEFQNLLDFTTRNLVVSDNTYVTCPNKSCGHFFQRVDQNREQIIQLLLSSKREVTEAEICKEQHRFLCRNCKTEFCANCSSVPFHETRTCDEHQHYLEAKHCRFCSDIVATSSKSDAEASGFDVCNKFDCQLKRYKACNRKLSCGHYCCGIRGEIDCLPCFQEDCAKLNNLTYSGDEYCNICFIEQLQEGPCIQLVCSHIFHEACVRKKLVSKWSGARITFGFMDCPLCKREIQHTSLNDLLIPLTDMKNKVMKKCKRRLEIERPSDIEDRSDEGLMKYAFSNFAYYQCYRCEEPYFGGRRQCDMNMGDDKEEFNARELVCGSCLSKEFDDSRTCPTHGTEFLEFKCKFCCNVAVWYCWGNTHFCQRCHEIQCQTHRLTKTPKDALPKCPGSNNCPVGGNHPDNGEEFALGCAICRKVALEQQFM